MLEFFKDDTVQKVLIALFSVMIGILITPIRLHFESRHKQREATTKKARDRANASKNIRRSSSTSRGGGGLPSMTTTYWLVNPFWILRTDGDKAELRGNPQKILLMEGQGKSDGMGGHITEILPLDYNRVVRPQTEKDWMLFMQEGDSLRFLRNEAAEPQDVYLFEPS